MTYPSPEKWRDYADHARSMAEAFRAEGNEAMAERRDADAEFYLNKAFDEEARIARRAPVQEIAA